jgi:hypothetical protein
MPYELTHTHLNGVMRLEMSGHISLADFQAMNDVVMENIEQLPGSSFLIMDMTQVESLPFYIEQARETQKFTQHQRMKSIYIISTNKLHRLAMLVLFSLARARVHLCDSEIQALRLVQIRA